MYRLAVSCGLYSVHTTVVHPGCSVCESVSRVVK